MKLNLGCGQNKMEGFVNVDRQAECAPDLVHDLETFPWPWADASVEAIVLNHVLEHLGEELGTYRRIWQEIYRVLQPDGTVLVRVPHPHCDDFDNDPTHVRKITPKQLLLLDQEFNRACAEQGFADSPLGLYWGVDFKMVSNEVTPTATYLEKNPAKREDVPWMLEKALTLRNQIRETSTVLKAVKHG